MDEPIFTLDFPKLCRVEVSLDGEWTLVESSHDISIYDRYGKLVGQLSYGHMRHNTRIHNNEVAYIDEQGQIHIHSLPEWNIVFEMDVSDWVKGGFIFNQSWIVMLHPSEPVVIRRRDKNIQPFLISKIHPYFIDEHSVFVAISFEDLYVYDLQQRETTRSLPSGAYEIAPGTLYFLKHTQMAVQLWKYEPPEFIRSLPRDRYYKFYPDGKHICSVAFSNLNFTVQRIDNREIVAQFNLSTCDPEPSKLALTCSNDGWVRQFDLMTGKLLHTLDYLPGNPFQMSSSGKYVALLGTFECLVFDLNAGEVVWKKPTYAGRMPYPFSDLEMGIEAAIHGSWVVVQMEWHIEIWDFLEDRLIAECPGQAVAPVLLPPHLYFSGLNTQGNLILRKFDIEKQVVLIDQKIEWKDKLYFTEASGLIMDHPESYLTQLDETSLSQKRIIEYPPLDEHAEPVINDHLFATRSPKGITIQSLEDGTHVNLLPGDRNYPKCFSKDCSLLATMTEGDRKTISFWATYGTGLPLYTLESPDNVSTVMFVSDNTLVTTSYEGPVNFWDITHITKGMV